MKRFTSKQVAELNRTMRRPQEALRWLSENLHPRVAKASSFGAEDTVIVDMMAKINPNFRFFTLDTGRLPQATYDAMDAMRRRYHTRIEVLFPDATAVQDMVNQKGPNLFYESVENRRLCCRIRKVDPMDRMLATLDGWITGLRRDQTIARHNAEMFQLDEAHGGILKVNPIIDWSWEDVWAYIKKYNLPYNRLLDRGYSSIGCEPCTRAVADGEDVRAGRWWWEQGIKECGIHLTHK